MACNGGTILTEVELERQRIKVFYGLSGEITGSIGGHCLLFFWSTGTCVCLHENDKLK